MSTSGPNFQTVAELDEWIGRVADAAPPLTDEQRERLTAIFRPVSAPAEAPATRDRKAA